MAHINRLEIRNFMRIEALTVDAKGNHVSITGRNGSGKSSAVGCLYAILGGMPGKELPEPIRQGAKQAVGRLELDDYIVERKWTESGSTLTMTAKDGTRIRRPQEILDGLLGRFSLDPVAFLKRTPVQQVADVLKVMGIDPPVDDVKNLTGEKIDAIEDETADEYFRRLIGDRVGIFYVRRAEKRRIMSEKEKAHQESVKTMLEMGGPPTAEEMEADATELHHQLQKANADNLRFAEAQHAVQLAHNKITLSTGKQAAIKSRLEAFANRKKSIDEQIARLQSEKNKIDESIQIAEGELTAAENETKLLGEAHRDLWHKSKEIEDPAPKIVELNQRIHAATQQSEDNAKRQQAAQHCQRLQEELEEAKEDAERLHRIVELIRDLSVKLLKGLDLGIQNLEVGNAELRLNGVSFIQASHAEKIRVACAVAMRQNPGLKVLRIDDGEHLDAESRQSLLSIASENKWQVFITAVADSQDVKVEIIDKIPEK